MNKQRANIAGMYVLSSSISILLIHYLGVAMIQIRRVLQEGHSMKPVDDIAGGIGLKI